MTRAMLLGAVVAGLFVSATASGAVSINTTSINTTPGPTIVIGSGQHLNDAAVLSGGANPTGTITFTLFEFPNVPVFTDVVTVNGNGTYATSTSGNNPGGFLPTLTGTYQWTAAYSGDGRNRPASTNVGDEPQTVSPASPSLTTVAGGTVVLGSGVKLTDTATLSGGFNPGALLTFTLRLLAPPFNTVYQDNVSVSGNGTYDTSMGDHPGGFLPTVPGTYEWEAIYGGDNNNNFARDDGRNEHQLVTAATAVPEPATLLLVGSTLAGLGAIRRMWRR